MEQVFAPAFRTDGISFSTDDHRAVPSLRFFGQFVSDRELPAGRPSGAEPKAVAQDATHIRGHGEPKFKKAKPEIRSWAFQNVCFRSSVE
jgi:hypothetical protein